MRLAPVITIDGPSGVGKGTIAKGIANHLGFHLLDSGALYRLVAWWLQQHAVSSPDAHTLPSLLAELHPRFASDGSISAPGCDEIGGVLRTEEIGRAASKIAAWPLLRRLLLPLQRGLRRPPGLVADGRDMGLVVFPDAALKVFLTASLELRAQRRQKQLLEAGSHVSLAQLCAALRARDRHDTERIAAPLRQPDDAVVLDTSDISVEETLHRVFCFWHTAQQKAHPEE